MAAILKIFFNFLLLDSNANRLKTWYETSGDL